VREPQIHTIIGNLQAAIPNLQLLYLYGSQAKGLAHPGSDVDLAFLAEGPLDAVARWDIQQALAVEINRDVDLVDLRQATEVLKMEIISTGQCLFFKGLDQKQLFESRVLEQYLDLADLLMPIIAKIKSTGSVYQ
jgi:predicted nucleotidyltransferase